MSSNMFVVLSDGSKNTLFTLIFVLLLVFILVIVVVGLIGKLTQNIMHRQGLKIDKRVSEVIRLKVTKEKKTFIKYATKKNLRLFIKQSWIPLMVVLFGSLVLIIHNAVTNNWGYNIWDCHKTGIGTWFFTWDFSKAEYTEVFFLPFKILKSWPPILTTPHWSPEAWASYIFVPCLFVGGIWYLLSLQALVARHLRIMKIAKNVYEVNLDSPNPMNPNNNN